MFYLAQFEDGSFLGPYGLVHYERDALRLYPEQAARVQRKYPNVVIVMARSGKPVSSGRKFRQALLVAITA